VPPSSFATNARVCSWSAAPDLPGGCDGAGEQCVRAPTAPYGTRLCVYQVGDPAPAACPAGPFTSYHVYYGSAVDSRDCSECTCGAAAGGTCSGTVGFFGTAACAGGASNTYAFGTGCLTLVSPVHAMGAYTPSGGACGPGIGGQPIGKVEGTRATTVCCM
jgi:hypothetical protein